MFINVIKRMKIWCRVLWALFQTREGVQCNVLSAEETIEKILKGKSLIRFGDGEFGIYQGKNIHYQKWTPDLKEQFIAIKGQYEKEGEHCPYLLAVPNKFLKINSKTLLKKRVWASSWAEARLYFKRNFKTDIVYGDAFTFEKKNRELYEKVWSATQSHSNIFFIHNDEKYAQEFAKRYNKMVTFIQCPSKNAFQELQNIFVDCEEKLSKCNKDEQVQFVISAGPAGKILAYYFANKGYQCIDTGHCWDEPLESE